MRYGAASLLVLFAGTFLMGCGAWLMVVGLVESHDVWIRLLGGVIALAVGHTIVRRCLTITIEPGHELPDPETLPDVETQLQRLSGKIQKEPRQQASDRLLNLV